MSFHTIARRHRRVDNSFLLFRTLLPLRAGSTFLRRALPRDRDRARAMYESAAASPYSDCSPNVPLDHASGVFTETSATHHAGQYSSMAARARSLSRFGCSDNGRLLIYHEIRIHIGPFALPFKCFAQLDTSFPHIPQQTCFGEHKTVEAASFVCEHRTPLLPWDGFGSSPPPQASIAVRLTVHNDQPEAPLAVWAYAVLSEASRCTPRT